MSRPPWTRPGSRTAWGRCSWTPRRRSPGWRFHPPRSGATAARPPRPSPPPWAPTACGSATTPPSAARASSRTTATGRCWCARGASPPTTAPRWWSRSRWARPPPSPAPRAFRREFRPSCASRARTRATTTAPPCRASSPTDLKNWVEASELRNGTRVPAGPRMGKEIHRGRFGVSIARIAIVLRGAAASADARVDPLLIISRQIHQPNMLVVLDTSGSLTGVPGGAFDTSTEVGVDCDAGVNCRGGSASGTCYQSGKFCASDAQCRTQSCSGDGMSCASNTDCRPLAGQCSQRTCNQYGANCQYASCFVAGDCPLGSTWNCTASGFSCSPSRPCTSTPRCQCGGATCSLGSNCAPYGLCLTASNQTTSQTCSVDSDCPLKSTGTCATGGDTCTSASSCSVKLCGDRATTCTADSQCGVCSRGTSSRGTYCTRNSDCTRSGATCSVTAGSCTNINNTCSIPNYRCQLQPAPTLCRETNSCVGPANTCTPGPSNTCAPGTVSDSCNFASTTPSALGKCRISLLKCQKDSDCPTSGDDCGPATSRVVIAKRVLADIVNNNSGIVNFGFMTFYQSLYFPYYRQTSTGTASSTIN